MVILKNIDIDMVILEGYLLFNKLYFKYWRNANIEVSLNLQPLRIYYDRIWRRKKTRDKKSSPQLSCFCEHPLIPLISPSWDTRCQMGHLLQCDLTHFGRPSVKKRNKAIPSIFRMEGGVQSHSLALGVFSPSMILSEIWPI